MTDATPAPPQLIQPSPRLHEINWFWRRAWSFGVTLVCLALLAWIIGALAHAGLTPQAAQPLAWVGFGLIALIAFVGLLYVAGATAYEFVQLASATCIQVASLNVGDRR